MVPRQAGRQAGGEKEEEEEEKVAVIVIRRRAEFLHCFHHRDRLTLL